MQEKSAEPLKNPIKDVNGQKIEVVADADSIKVVSDFMGKILDESGCCQKSLKQVLIVVDELYGNVAKYAYGEKCGKASVFAEIKDCKLTITIEDGGRAFNPLNNDPPDITLSAENRPIGGLGVFISKALTDEIRYERKNDKNVLYITKTLI